jgi:hypothetical protein
MKQVTGCRYVSSHCLHPLIGFDVQTVTNLLPFGFEAQTKNPSQWFWGPNHQTVDIGFEAQTKKPSLWFWDPNHQIIATGFEAKPGNPCFSSPPRVRCRSHTMSSELPIVRPSSIWLVLDYPRFSARSLLLLPRSSSLSAMLYSPPTHHEISKHVSPYQITQFGVSSTECTESKFKLNQVNYSSHK